MASWKNNPNLIKQCPECHDCQVRLAHAGVPTKPDERIYHCPRCKAVFTHEELFIHWARADSRPWLIPEGWTVAPEDITPSSDVSDVV